MKTAVKAPESSDYRRGLGIFVAETPSTDRPKHLFRPLFPRNPHFPALRSDSMALSAQLVPCCIALLWMFLPTKTIAASITQWTEVSGGNGHWYEAVTVSDGISWGDAKLAAELKGGHLATILSQAENNFVFSLVDSPQFWTEPGSYNGTILGVWLGAFSDATGNWKWLTGELLTYSNWLTNQPDYYGGMIQGMDYCGGSTWNDFAQDGTDGFNLPVGYVVEYATIPEPSVLMISGIFAISLFRRTICR